VFCFSHNTFPFFRPFSPLQWIVLLAACVLDLATAWCTSILSVLSAPLKQQLHIDNEALGALMSASGIAAVFVPALAGVLLRRWAPAAVTACAMVFVMAGMVLSALAVHLEFYVLLFVGYLCVAARRCTLVPWLAGRLM
jgi:MFS family permease